MRDLWIPYSKSWHDTFMKYKAHPEQGEVNDLCFISNQSHGEQSEAAGCYTVGPVGIL